jgi:hypothetical protein
VADNDEQHRLTVVLKKLSPGWAWLRANFTLPSVITIAGILGGAAMYIINLRTRVTVLEQTVTIVQKVAPDVTALAVLRQRVDDHDRRIETLEGAWTEAVKEAHTPLPQPAPASRRKGR